LLESRKIYAVKGLQTNSPRRKNPQLVHQYDSYLALVSMRGLDGWCWGILPAGGLLYLYGPFLQEGKSTAPSNLVFDTSLRDRNPK
jgi:hypothetical protein